MLEALGSAARRRAVADNRPWTDEDGRTLSRDVVEGLARDGAREFLRMRRYVELVDAARARSGGEPLGLGWRLSALLRARFSSR